MLKVILLDIDGVLAPLGKVESEFITVDLDGWSKIAIPRDNIEFLEYINYKVKVIWSSSWEATSNNICTKIGIEHFDYLRIGNTYSRYWNKLPVMIDFIQNNPDIDILIIDDEIDINSKEKLCNYDNVTILEVEPINGLSMNNKSYITKWINNMLNL